MMMTSGGAVHYKSMFDAGSQIVAKEGAKSLFKGAGANILRGIAGAGVLSLYDKLQEVMFGKVYSGGMSFVLVAVVDGSLTSVLQVLVKRICRGHFTLYQPHSTIAYLARYTTSRNRYCRYFSGIAWGWTYYHHLSTRSRREIARFLIPLTGAPDRTAR